MKKLSNLIYFGVTLAFFAYLNFYFSNLIAFKLLHGWRFASKLVRTVYIENTGAAFSIMQGSIQFLIALSIIALIVILFFVIKNSDKISMKALFFVSLMSAGICGNLYERLAFGYVRDFFDLTFFSFPIFNISDIFINIGVLGIIILILLKKPIKNS